MAGGRVGRLVERELLPEAWTRGVRARCFGLLAFGRQAACGWLNAARVKLVQLLYVRNNVSHLRRKGSTLFLCDFQMREQRDFFDVSFGNRHKSVVSGQWSVVSVWCSVVSLVFQLTTDHRSPTTILATVNATACGEQDSAAQLLVCDGFGGGADLS